MWFEKNQVTGIERCPQCGIAVPLVSKVGDQVIQRIEGNTVFASVMGQCSSCKKCILFEGMASRTNVDPRGQISIMPIFKCFPEARKAADEIPQRARSYLQQALESRHAPDGAAMLASSAIDWMLKEKNYKEGSLYSRIEKAVSDGLFTIEMRDWAHEIRLSANEPRHADENHEGYSADEVDQIIHFAESLGEYLFVLPARIRKWKGAGNLA